MSGTLFVVATPIGNLEDVTLRALKVLTTVDLIAAEDTRRTARLLARHGISKPMLSFHEHNAHGRVPQLLERLRRGERIALVSDAGTPAVSDPGTELIRECIVADIAIEPVPGASAPITAVVASGFPVVPLTILGFVPRRSQDRTAWFVDVSKISHTFTFFEAPHRLSRTLREAIPVFGERPICAARELTKVHQEFVRGTARELYERLEQPRGEFTIVVGPASPEEVAEQTADDESVVREFRHTTESLGMQRREAIKHVAVKCRVSPKHVYSVIERSKNMANGQSRGGHR